MNKAAETLEVRAPYNGELLACVDTGSKETIADALTQAAQAQPIWARMPLHERADILLRYRDLVRDNLEDIAKILCQDNGKPITQARAEISNQLVAVPAFVEHAKHLHGDLLTPGAEKGWERHLQLSTRKPMGVIASIIPFNFPANMLVQKVIPGLIMGNAVLVLPPSGNPLAVMKLVSYLHEAGVPREVLPCIVARGALKEEAVRNPHTSLVTLTGSTKTGKHIAQIAANNLTRYTLELGGNDPFIVTPEADMDLAIKEAVSGRIANAGQICCANKRFIVHESKAKAFTEGIIEELGHYKTGDPLDENTRLSCLINERAAKTVEEQVAHTLEQGAQLLVGNKREGAFFSPTVLSHVTAQMDIACDLEIFGPVFPIISYTDEDEAVKIANQSSFGLSSAVFTENPKTFQRIAQRIQAGTVVANGSSYMRSFEMPFSGWKESGIGSEGVMSSLEEFTQPKMIIWKNLFD